MQKKKNIILGVLVVILVVLICTLIVIIGKKNSKAYQSVEELNLATLKDKINNKDKFVLVVTQTGCSHCVAYLPILEEVGEDYKLKFYDINITNLSDDEKTEFNKIVRISGTPTTIFYVDGEEVSTSSRLVGEKSKEKIISRLKSEGYINE